MNAEERRKRLALWITQYPEYGGLMKDILYNLARTNPKELREVSKELCRQKRARRNPLYKGPFYKYPRRRKFFDAYYEACGDSTSAPTFPKVKATFIAKYGEKEWNRGHDDDPKAGDFSARKTLTRLLGLPLTEMKKGRPPGSKSSRLSGPQALRERIARK